MLNYFILLIILIFAHRCRGHNLDIQVTDLQLFRSCNDSNIPNMEDIVEINLAYDLADDMETMTVNGNVTVLKDFPQDELMELHTDFLQWKRGKWEKTIYSIRYNDFCSVMFDPSMMWYRLVQKVPEEKRKCPPVEGTVFYFENVEYAMKIENVKVFVEGKFKIVAQLKTKSFTTCMITIADVWTAK